MFNTYQHFFFHFCFFASHSVRFSSQLYHLYFLNLYIHFFPLSNFFFPSLHYPSSLHTLSEKHKTLTTKGTAYLLTVVASALHFCRSLWISFSHYLWKIHWRPVSSSGSRVVAGGSGQFCAGKCWLSTFYRQLLKRQDESRFDVTAKPTNAGA